MNLVVQRLEIRGHVQGVGFRWSMAGQAARLGVHGWVRNRRDGSVEAMVAGSPEAVQQMIEWAKHGPRGAAVSRVDVSPGEGTFGRFESLPTA